MICTRCGRELAEWIISEDEAYCQMCWEAHCSEEWWRLNLWQNRETTERLEDEKQGIKVEVIE